jgi:GT2 family glycosyltransferase
MNTYVRPLNGGLVERAKVMAAAAVDLSVVMVVYRTGAALQESLARVLDDPTPDEFIIVDNGSRPDEEAWQNQAAAQDDRVRIIRGHGNVGFARGANMGAMAAHGRILVFLNPDAFIEGECLSGLREAVDDAPSLCVVGARVLNVDGTEQRGARRGEVTPVTTLLSLTRLAHLRPLRGFEIHHQDDPTPEQPISVPTISGACFAMTRADFSAMGGFDEGYFLHVEDVDLCWRVRKSGGLVLFHPSAQVVHLGSTSHTSPMKVEFWKGLGLVRYFRKRANNPGRALLANVLAPLIMLVSILRPLIGRRLR